jgi:hypothetical protein
MDRLSSIRAVLTSSAPSGIGIVALYSPLNSPIQVETSGMASG